MASVMGSGLQETGWPPVVQIGPGPEQQEQDQLPAGSLFRDEPPPAEGVLARMPPLVRPVERAVAGLGLCVHQIDRALVAADLQQTVAVPAGAVAVLEQPLRCAFLLRGVDGRGEPSEGA